MPILNTQINWRTKTEMIYSTLREAIVSGDLKPGERIVLSKVASELGVSTIPVREAIKQLSTEGLIDLSAHSEATVSRLSEKDFRELADIRVLLESYATKLAAERSTPEFVTQLKEELTEMQDCIDQLDYKRYGVLNLDFHQTIYSFCGNEHLRKLIDSMTLRTDRARAIFSYNQSRLKESFAEHQAIVQAIEAGQVEQAAEVVAAQTRVGLKSFLEYSLHSQDQTLIRD